MYWLVDLFPFSEKKMALWFDAIYVIYSVKNERQHLSQDIIDWHCKKGAH